MGKEAVPKSRKHQKAGDIYIYKVKVKMKSLSRV